MVEVSKQFFPTTLATAFNDPRLSLHFMDAAEYMKVGLTSTSELVSNQIPPHFLVQVHRHHHLTARVSHYTI